jgi:Fibronectin type III domain
MNMASNRPSRRQSNSGSQNRPLESLEQRRFLSLVAAINFQPAWAPAMPGMDVDSGQAFGRRTGTLSYGWDVATPGATRDRNSPDVQNQAYDTLIHFGSSRGSAAKWEIAVPDGEYEVRVVSGDPSFIDSRHVIEVEGATVVNEAPSWNKRFVEGKATVDVRDGRLTLTPGSGAWNNKINFLTISRAEETPAPVTPATPAAPHSLIARDVTARSAVLSWTDPDSREDGFVVEQSTDGANWRTLAWLGRNSTGYSVNQLGDNARYYFRVRSANAAGLSPVSNVVEIRTLALQPTTPTTNVNPGFIDGVTMNPEFDPNQTIPLLRNLGVNAIRLWSDYEYHWNFSSWYINVAKQYHDAGFHVTMLLHNENVPQSYEQAKNWFANTVDRPGFKDYVDRWEIANEINLNYFFKGSLSEYVNLVLKPASEVLRARGEPVIGGAVSKELSAVRELRDLGYLNYVDYAGFHSYSHNAADQELLLNEVKQIFAGKPLILTEWNLHTWNVGGEAEWTRRLNEARPYVVANTAGAYYYHFLKSGTLAGNAGLFRVDQGRYVPNGLFHQMYDSWDVRQAADEG